MKYPDFPVIKTNENDQSRIITDEQPMSQGLNAIGLGKLDDSITSTFFKY
jgi:hypothetical protein